MLCPACTGIGPENCRKCLADCFEITGFHAQSPNGRVVIRLHVLRSRLRKLERELPDDRKANGTLYHQPIITDDLPWVWRKNMSEELAFAECDRLVREFEQVVKKPVKKRSSIYYTGVDLGTACVVLAVLDENRRPVAGAYRYADVVRDGMVVDYIGAIRLVREMKEELEEKLGTELIYAAAAIPPGTDALDGGAIKNVVQGAGFEITALLDEPTAANQILKIQNGAVVDIGGGTTGISILKWKSDQCR